MARGDEPDRLRRRRPRVAARLARGHRTSAQGAAAIVTIAILLAPHSAAAVCCAVVVAWLGVARRVAEQ